MAEKLSGDLFGAPEPGAAADRSFSSHAPLAERTRPATLAEVVGQRHLVSEGRLLRDLVTRGESASLIFWGPPGVGKTTLARILADHSGTLFVELSATAAGVKEVRRVASDAVRRVNHDGRRTLLFIDEIHRFNKTQQDALLPWVENGSLVLVGATTENPSFEVVAPLLSRCRVLRLEPLDESEIVDVLERVLAMPPPRGLDWQRITIDPEVIPGIARAADGDARKAINTLELAVQLAAGGGEGAVSLDWSIAEQALQRRMPRYGREEHFDQVSALQKSIRSSDPQAAIYWLARMVESGEDPMYIARRLVRIASEDVGLADPRALEIALAAQQAAHSIGFPEGALALAQAAVYLSVAPKSDALTRGYAGAVAAVQERGDLPVPLQLRNAVTSLMSAHGYGSGYRHAHEEETGIADMQCLPDDLVGSRFYEPTERGVEARVAERMREIERLRGRRQETPDPTSARPSE